MKKSIRLLLLTLGLSLIGFSMANAYAAGHSLASGRGNKAINNDKVNLGCGQADCGRREAKIIY